MGKSKNSDRRRIREVGEDEIGSLLRSLEYDQLLTAWFRLTTGERGARPKSVFDVEEKIEDCGRPKKEIIRVLRHVECESPRKHCFFGTITAGKLKDAADALSGLSVRGTKIAFVTTEDGFLSVTAERTVRSIEWKMSGEKGHRSGKEVTVLVRHATVIRIELSTKRVLFTYPPLPAGTDETFDTIIAVAIELLFKAGLTFKHLPIRECISSLLRGGARRVALSRGKFETVEGKFQVASTTRGAPLDQVLASLLQADRADRHKLEKQINTSLQKQTFDQVTLTWIDEKVSTRIDFIDSGPEFLFFWGDAEKTFAKIQAMIGLLYDIAAGLQSADFKKIWGDLASLSDGTVIVPTEFASRYNVDNAVTQQVILDAVNAGLMVPVYRLKADEDLLEEHGVQAWSEDLRSLRRMFVTDAAAVDGTVAKNIKVGFRRTEHAPTVEDRT